jgi:gamma-glutamylcyclotransferase (GGCT)/AIG2-like uncharacterized protein YtfP
MTSHVFTYGSLMFAQVWRRVVKGNYDCAPARARDYARFAVAGQAYPGMVAMQGESVHGLVYFDVDAADIALLDAFEGHEYQRRDIDVELEDGNRIAANAYIYIDKSGLTTACWDPEQFQMHRFIGAFCDPDSGQ